MSKGKMFPLEAVGLLTIQEGKVHVKGSNGQGQCRLDQPHEIGLLIIDLMTSNAIGQPAYRPHAPSVYAELAKAKAKG